MVLDDDEDDDSDNTDIAKFVFSLIDPISKVPMKIPVRGRSCKHWQVCMGTILYHFGTLRTNSFYNSVLICQLSCRLA